MRTHFYHDASIHHWFCDRRVVEGHLLGVSQASQAKEIERSDGKAAVLEIDTMNTETR